MAARSVHAPAKVPPSVLTQVVGVVALAFGASLLSVTVKTMVAASAVDEIPAHESSSNENKYLAARHFRKNTEPGRRSRTRMIFPIFFKEIRQENIFPNGNGHQLYPAHLHRRTSDSSI
jgi:hypothetical protein